MYIISSRDKLLSSAVMRSVVIERARPPYALCRRPVQLMKLDEVHRRCQRARSETN